MTVYLAPSPRQQYLDSSGVPYAGAKLFYYAAGTTTKQNTYTTSSGGAANTNPIILDASGRTPYGVWLTSGVSYKEVLAPSTDTDPPTSPIFTEDNIAGVNDNSDATNQWKASGVTPTYVSATQFTVPGDKTSTFLVDRRIKVTETAGTVYGYVSVVAYTTLTTVTVVLDSGTLDSGISAVEVGILTDLNSAIPLTITRNTTAQTLTNKSLSDSTTFIIDNSDATKKAKFQASGITTGTTREYTFPDEDLTFAGRGANTFTGTQTLSGKSLIDANASVAANATTSTVWLLGNYVTLTGSATVFTNVAAAPQAGAEVELYCNAAHTFTNNANLIVDGGADFVAAIGDRVLLRAQSTTVFTVHPRRKSGRAVIYSSVLDRRAITTTDTVGTADIGNLIDCTSGTFTLTFAAAATLGDQATGYIQNSGTGDVTIDGNGAETIDGLANYVMYPGEIRRWYVEGSAIKTIIERKFRRSVTSTESITWPPGYLSIVADVIGGGAGGNRCDTTTSGGGGGGGGGRCIKRVSGVTAGTSVTCTIGAAGVGATANNTLGTAGGDSSFGTYVIATGGPGNATSPQGSPGGAGQKAHTTATAAVGLAGGSTAGVGNTGVCAEYGGGGGGGGGGVNTAGFAGGSSLFGAGGGGGGGDGDFIGGAGGIPNSYTAGGGAAGGAIATIGTAGTAGTNGEPGGGGGGGGGSAAGTGGAGGAGAAPGGGGGGGGSGATSGNGGNGARGEITLYGE